ncbi:MULTISPECIES: LytTR family DNA-binding domain-containing protein [unclassified Myroides]|uniref:LytR/AlgR family response regulator transcription factor n=1 Tax=unclassified Myroides TaxID=2642485 RepID=UPI0015FAE51F|nr:MULTISPECIES: LytTR family DNA-binding domain-containing protein [unclassified Myroides]MBB1149723.1 response regulator transcription factor [Myroides sp. NP-2]MDM1408653.1 response regulator transcription factor [Myroides sp. DF42-4-2]
MKVYILEDEVAILKYILSLVVDIPYLQVVGYADSIAKAYPEIIAQQPDLILADIQLKDGSSFELLQRLNSPTTQLIFITAYSQYAIKALNLGALGYLVKPIDDLEFTQAIERCYQKKTAYLFEKAQIQVAQEQLQTPQLPKRLALKTFHYTQIVCIADIVYCQSDKGYTTFYLANGEKLMVSKVIKEYEDLLIPAQFIRCHQSYMVNTAYISKYYKDGYLELTNQASIPVSERKKELILSYIQSIS